jgi:hypothetical protein
MILRRWFWLTVILLLLLAPAAISIALEGRWLIR